MSPSEAWKELKEAGSAFYKSKDFCSAIAQYEKAAASCLPSEGKSCSSKPLSHIRELESVAIGTLLVKGLKGRKNITFQLFKVYGLIFC